MNTLILHEIFRIRLIFHIFFRKIKWHVARACVSVNKINIAKPTTWLF